MGVYMCVCGRGGEGEGAGRGRGAASALPLLLLAEPRMGRLPSPLKKPGPLLPSESC